LTYFHSCISQGLFLNRIAVFPVFRLLKDFFCLLTYELCLSLWKIALCSLIFLLPLCINSGMLVISYHTLLTDIYNKPWLPNSLSRPGPFLILKLSVSCRIYYRDMFIRIQYKMRSITLCHMCSVGIYYTVHHPRLINIIMI
jgi:hypothetical protein